MMVVVCGAFMMVKDEMLGVCGGGCATDIGWDKFVCRERWAYLDLRLKE